MQVALVAGKSRLAVPSGWPLTFPAKENGLNPFRYLVWVRSKAPALAIADAEWSENSHRPMLRKAAGTYELRTKPFEPCGPAWFGGSILLSCSSCI